jgi:magnesium-transporting ATPase (P-type)
LTLKGQLIRKILFPSQTENKFQKESTKFLFFLFALVLSCYFMMVFKLAQNIDAWTIVRRGFDLISIGVPPTLPISMTIGIIYAI